MEAEIIKESEIKRSRFDKLIEAVWLSVIFLIPVYLNPLGYASFYVAKSLILELLVSVLLGLALAQWFLRAPAIKFAAIWNGFKTRPLQAAVLVYGLLWSISTACSIMPERSFWGNLVRETGLVTMLTWIVFFMVITQKIRCRAQVYRALYALLISAALVSLLGIVQFLNPRIPGWNLLGGRVYSTDGNPLSLSAFLSMVIPINLAMLIVTWYDFKNGKKSPFKSIAALAAFMLMAGCLVLAQYSLTLLLYVLGIFTFFGIVGIYLRRRTTFTLAFLSLLLLAVIAVALMGQLFIRTGNAPPSAEGGTTPTLSEQVGLPTLNIRMQVWESAARVILESPGVPFHQDNLHPFRRAIGYGPGTMGVLMQAKYPELLRSQYTFQSILLGQPENHYLYLAATTGILGLIAFIAVLGLFCYSALRVLARTKDTALIVVTAACIASVFQYCVHLFFNPSAIDPDMVFWLTLGLPTALTLIIANEEKAVAHHPSDTVTGACLLSQHTANAGRKMLAGCTFLIFVAIGLMLTANPFLADLKLRSALTRFNFNDKQAALGMCVEATNIQPRQPAYHGYLARIAYLMALRADNSMERSHLLKISELAYGEASRLESGVAYWNYMLGDIYTYWMLNGAKDKWADALHAYENADGLFPDNAVILNKWALALMLGGDYAEAEQKLKDAYRSDPSWAQNSYYMGLLLMHKGKTGEAINLLGDPFLSGPVGFDDFSYYLDFCYTAALYGQVDLITDALRAHPDEVNRDWIKLSLLGIADIYAKNPQEAIDAFRRSAEIVPPDNATMLAGIIKGVFPAGSIWHPEAEQIAERLIEKASRAK